MIPTSNSKSNSVVNSKYDLQDDDKKPSSPLANQADEGEDFKNSDLPAIVIRDWRYELQDAFLSLKTPKPEAMPELDQLFTTVENYNDMTIEQLQFSKIGKVMRHICAVPDERIPREDEFRFRERAKRLFEKWYQLLDASDAGHPHWKSEEKVSEEVPTPSTLKDDTSESVASKMAGPDTTALLADVTIDGHAQSDDNKKPWFPQKEKSVEGDGSENIDPQSIIVRDWRHKLQKGFLYHKRLPKPEDMPELDQLFTIVENYNEMTIEQLHYSKIRKVMRHISDVANERVPRDDEFRFRVRAKRLIEKWDELLDTNQPLVKTAGRPKERESRSPTTQSLDQEQTQFLLSAAVMEQFLVVDPYTTEESDFYGPFNSLLFELFPTSEKYQVSPKVNRVDGSFNFTIQFVVRRHHVPVFFIEVRTFQSLKSFSTRADSDDQMRRTFREFASSTTTPTVLYGLSAFGTRFCVYMYDSALRSLYPPCIARDLVILNDTAPEARWMYDLIEEEGEAKLREIVNDVKGVDAV